MFPTNGGVPRLLRLLGSRSFAHRLFMKTCVKVNKNMQTGVLVLCEK